MNWRAMFIDNAWPLAAIALLLLASAFFSGSETALFNLSRAQIFSMGRSRNRLNRIVSSLMSRPRRLLNSLLLANQLVNVAFAGLAGGVVVSLERYRAPAWVVVVVSVAPLLALILVGEVAPKVLAYTLRDGWARAAAPLLYVVARVLGPLAGVVQAAFVGPLTRLFSRSTGGGDLTSEELASLMDLSAKRGVLGQDASELLQEILELGDMRVSEIMVPRVDVVAFDVAGDPAELAALFARTHLHRIPVYEGDVDHILGLAEARTFLLDPDTPLRRQLREVIYVPETATAERVLLQLRVRRQQTAIVVDEYGGTAGLVTMEDIVEEIVGDIRDVHEAPPQPPVRKLAQRQYLLDGDLGIHEWAEAFGADLAARRVATVGGFVASLLGRIPHVGDSATYRNLRLTVESMRRRRVGTIRLELLEGPPA